MNISTIFILFYFIKFLCILLLCRDMYTFFLINKILKIYYSLFFVVCYIVILYIKFNIDKYTPQKHVFFCVIFDNIFLNFIATITTKFNCI
jgi:hypothetical protein